MNTIDISERELIDNNRQLDKELMEKIMSLTLDGINKEVQYRSSMWRVDAKLVDDKFVVNVNVKMPGSWDDGNMQFVQYIISRSGTVERIVNKQSMEEIAKEKYREAINMLGEILKDVKAQNFIKMD